ncbi:S10 family serine carboxypeptidase-like protein [Pelagerythrobacter aerophilus]|nr:peptidase S10 [Pelagerythrobacter aerophilus]
MPFRRCLLSILLATAAAPALAQDADAPMSPAFLRAMEPMVPREEATSRVIATDHAIVLGGKRIGYRAIVSEQPLPDPQGKPAVVAVTYAYVAEGLGDADTRPVLFVFNGGPGASSSPLHMHAFGPRRIVGGGADMRLADNPYSLLDVADLVFIDPPGTGASMPVDGADATSFWGVKGDAQAAIRIIDEWKRANGRLASPTVLVGESYGTARAAAMLNELQSEERPLPDAVVLLSPSLGWTDGPILSQVTTLPTFAAVAWYHDAIDRRGRDVAAHFAAARHFAETDYVSALAQGSRLPADERRRVAEKLSTLIGLPANQIEEERLRIGKLDFMLSLLGKRGLRTGQLDARVTRSIEESKLRPPFDDPSMSLGSDGPNVIERYLTEELGYSLPSAYRSLNLGINFQWNWGEGYGGSYHAATFAPYLATALEADPSMRLFVAGGYYDITTPVHAGPFALDQAGVPRDRYVQRGYPAGHSIFEDETQLAELAADLRTFVSGETRSN